MHAFTPGTVSRTGGDSSDAGARSGNTLATARTATTDALVQNTDPAKWQPRPEDLFGSHTRSAPLTSVTQGTESVLAAQPHLSLPSGASETSWLRSGGRNLAGPGRSGDGGSRGAVPPPHIPSSTSWSGGSGSGGSPWAGGPDGSGDPLPRRYREIRRLRGGSGVGDGDVYGGGGGDESVQSQRCFMMPCVRIASGLVIKPGGRYARNIHRFAWPSSWKVYTACLYWPWRSAWVMGSLGSPSRSRQWVCTCSRRLQPAGRRNSLPA